MKSFTTERFRKAYRRLPPEIRRRAWQAYQRFKQDPYHPGLEFKRVSSDQPLYSARVTHNYRVLGLWEGDEIVWIWIGSHQEYDRILRRR